MTISSASRVPGLVGEVSGSGAPLLAIHGLGVTRRWWDPVVPLIEPEAEVHRFDLPGFGASPMPRQPVDDWIHFLADQLERELDARQMPAPHVVGHSMGGRVALELAVRGRARTVTALAPIGGWTRAEAIYVRGATGVLRIGARAGRPFADTLMRTPARRRVLLVLSNTHGDKVSANAAAGALRAMADAPAFRAARNSCLRQQPEDVGPIACPATIVWGTADRLLFPRQSARIKTAVPRAHLIHLPGLGHDMAGDDPAATANAILTATGLEAAS